MDIYSDEPNKQIQGCLFLIVQTETTHAPVDIPSLFHLLPTSAIPFKDALRTLADIVTRPPIVVHIPNTSLPPSPPTSYSTPSTPPLATWPIAITHLHPTPPHLIRIPRPRLITASSLPFPAKTSRTTLPHPPRQCVSASVPPSISPALLWPILNNPNNLNRHTSNRHTSNRHTSPSPAPSPRTASSTIRMPQRAPAMTTTKRKSQRTRRPEGARLRSSLFRINQDVT